MRRIPCEDYDNHDCEECAHWTENRSLDATMAWCPVRTCVHHPYGMCYFKKREVKKDE